MGFDFNGFVLRAPRTAPGNASSTADATGGVVRDLKDTPGTYTLSADLVSVGEEQFRASTLENPSSTDTQEYLLWAANTSSLTLLEDPSWAVTAEDAAATVTIPTGSIIVTDTGPAGSRSDGINRLVVQDTAGRSISDVRLIRIFRGDTGAEITLGPDGTFPFASQDPDAGVVTLGVAALTALGGGASNRRGDFISEVVYVIAAARFWWTRNDRYRTRFGYNSKTQRWEPRKGAPTVNVGVLADGGAYTLVPRPTRFQAGDYLPGDVGSPDSYAMVRLGLRPDFTSLPLTVLVVSDAEATDDAYVFGAEDAILGANSGTLRFNPTFLDANAGQVIWYSFESYQATDTGEIGPLLGANTEPLFISPIPGPTETPFMRLGARRFLRATSVATESALPAPAAVPEGEVFWSQSTGKLVLSEVDVAKADPDDAGFDRQYLGERLFYDGVALTTRSIRTRDPVALVDDTGAAVTVGAGNKMYVPRSQPLPAPGVSGMLYVADGTGTLPNTLTVPSTRPNGSGMVREIEGVGDTIFFGKAGALEIVQVVEFEDDLPDFPFAIRKGKVWVARERDASGNRSQVSLGLKDRARFGGEFLYLLQADVLPAVFADEAIMYSRELEPFTFDGTETFYFAVDGVPYTWTPAGAGTFTAAAVAADLQTTPGLPVGTATALNGRVVLSSVTPATGTLEIGFGPSASVRDRSAAAALGFLPGWRIDGAASENWLPDNGSSIGLFRSPLNRDRSADTPDFNARGVFDNTLLSQSVMAMPYFSVDNPPIQDVAGYDQDIFFTLVEGLNITRLENFEDVRYDFGNNRFAWIDQATTTGQVTQPTTSLPLGRPSVLGDTLHPAVAAGNGLYLASTGGTFSLLELGTDYLLPGGGSTGQAVLSQNIGDQLAVGTAGTVTAAGTTFTDTNRTFVEELEDGTEADGVIVIWKTSGAGLGEGSLGYPSNLPLSPGKVTLAWTSGGLPQTQTDDGSGGFTGDGTPGGSSVTYSTGEILLDTTGAAPDVGTTISVSLIGAGDLLQIEAGTLRGWYIVAAVTSETTLEIDGAVPFGEADSFIAYRLFTAYTLDEIDPALLADVQYEVFNHLPEEPFKVRQLSAVGDVPTDKTAQASTRLSAVATESIQRGRIMKVRFGLAYGNDEALITPLVNTELGALANGALAVPDPADPHFINATALDPSFGIQVGTKLYNLALGNLIEVPDPTAFTTGLAGDVIEYGAPGHSSIEGQLNFGTDVLTDLEGSSVYYIQAYMDPDVLAAGEAEINPADGGLNLSTTDMAAHAGETGYFVEQMITEEQLDVQLSPLSGTLFFNRPLREFQIVEVSYFQANTDGTRVLDDTGSPTEITEFLPLFVREEECTRIDSRNYGFNPTGRTVASAIEPVVWVGILRQNYGSLDTASFSLDPSTATFTDEVTNVAESVRMNYAVYEAFGGEESFSTSAIPVWRPPFFLTAGVTDFFLDTDRTSDMVPGKMLRIGATPLYIQASSYDAGEDTTVVTVFPVPSNEVGSRAPGNDLNSLLTSEPVTTVVNGTPTTANAGFLVPLLAPFEPVDSGMLSIIFYGNVTQYAVPGHLLEIGGYPFLIAAGTLSESGYTTRIDVTTAFPKGFTSGVDAVKISLRPIYAPFPTQFLGLGPVVQTEASSLVLFGARDALGNELPGRTLLPNVEYSVDPNTGNVTLQVPPGKALLPGQRLVYIHTRLGALAPFVANGVVNFPRFRAKFSYIRTPDDTGLILGSSLLARYTFRNPDSFYFRAVPLRSYMGEVAQKVVSSAAAQSVGGGAITTAPGEPKNYEQGSLGLISQRQDLVDQDRASRTFISLYNEAIVSFEQLIESMGVLGGVVGDRHGKFRFFVGRDKVYPPPGWEDQITGVLNPRYVWFSVFESANGSFTVTLDDPIVDPETATQDPTTKEVEGDFMDPDLLVFYIEQQQNLIKNDIDDFVLTGRRRPKIKLKFPPFPTLSALGKFQQMGEAHRLSRLFPEATLAFTTTYPGLLANPALQDPGVYVFRKMLEPPSLFKGEGAVFGSTFRTSIGSVSNPALDTINNITDAEIRDRLPRARIWAWSATGFPDIEPATDGIPTVIATPLFLKDFPVDESTGLPDVSQFISQGGELPDLETGDVELSTPNFLAFDKNEKLFPQVAFGSPDGTTFAVGNAQRTIGGGLFGSLFDIDPVYGGVFVGAIYQGCLITFVDDKGNEISSASDILKLGAGELEGSPVNLKQGDTIFVIPPGSMDTTDADKNTPVDERQQFADNLPIYRRGFDIGLRKKNSEFTDLSLPSFKDPSPFGLQEILGQHPAKPLTTIEADVEFTNNSRSPHEFPALRGENVNDYGDYGIPYLSIGGTTELDRLGAIQSTTNTILKTDAPANLQAVYPEEIVALDGEVLGTSGAGGPPAATFITAADLAPGSPYSPNTGVGVIQRGDILLVEVPSTGGLPASAQGILNIAEVDTVNGYIEPPRFPTHSQLGDRFRYRFSNAMVHVSGPGVLGMFVIETGPNTVFDLSSIAGAPVLNDGSGFTTGGLNDLFDGPVFAFPNDNEIIISIIDKTTGLVVETVTITGTSATGGLGTAVLAATPTCTDKVLTVPTTGFIDFTNLGTITPGPSAEYDFAIEINTFNGGAALAGSHTGRVREDRLTFEDTWDMRSVQPRGTLTGGALNIEGRLNVARVTASGNEHCNVDGQIETNLNTPLTFLARDGSSTTIGTFSVGVGTVKVMAFEGHGNTAITTSTPVFFSAIPSSNKDENGDILRGVGTVLDGLTALLDVDATVGGALANVEAGDILQITESHVGDAAIKAGTYLVRHAVPESGSLAGAYGAKLSTTALSAAGWAPIVFPKVVLSSVVGLPREITVTDVSGPGPGGLAWPSGGRLYIIPDINDPTSVVSVAYTGTPTVGGVFTIVGGSGLAADGVTALTNSEIDALAVAGTRVSGMAYISITPPEPLPSNNVVGYQHAQITAGGVRHVTISNPNLFSDVLSGTQAQTFSFGPGGGNAITAGSPGADDLGVFVETPSASTSFLADPATPIYPDVPAYLDLSGLTGTMWDTIHTDAAGTTTGVVCVFPNDRLVTSDTVLSTGAADPSGADGFLALAGVFLEPSWVRPAVDLGSGTEKVVDFSRSLTAAEIGMRDVSSFLTAASTEEVEDGTEADGVIVLWRTSGAGVGEGTLLYPNSPITPGSFTVTWTSAASARTQTDDGSGGFTGDGNPSGSSVNYQTRELVIDTTGLAADAATTIDITYTANGERVSFEARRIRRFRSLLDGIGNNLGPLRFAYEIRRCEVLTYASRILTADTSTYGTATQLGDFDDQDVNINAGDDVLLLDSAGTVIDTARVAFVLASNQLILAQPGLTQPVSPGDTFHVYLRKAPVPHEQSNEELLALITEVEVFRKAPVPSTNAGGRVGTVNVLSDDTTDLTTVGVQPGDILVVDPAGELSGPTGQTSPPERGSRPFGDTGVSGRTGFSADVPSPLDDNRGWYRITEVGASPEDAAGLRVTGESAFTGPDSSTNVIFGAGGPPDQRFVIYPTVTGGGGEGQMDLRLTDPANGSNSYALSANSIEPFGYRIIRPSGIFSDETIDLVLMHRERILSWVEEITGPSAGTKQGNYFVFQRDEHITDVGSSDPDDGLGVPSNEALTTLSGEVDVAPFLNTSDCLSVLDRRYWILDTRLDSLRPPGATTGPYYSSFEVDAPGVSLGSPMSAGSGRPVLPDLVDDVLDRTDRLRGLRFAWIRFRTDKINGTLPAIARFDGELPRLLQEQEDLLRLQQGLDDA